jgi:hypothetical protein
MTGTSDARLERLFGEGAVAFRTAFDLVPDPVGVLWAIRDRGGVIADFETGWSNQAMGRMIGVPIEVSMGRRLVAEAPAFGEDETFARMRRVLLSCERLSLADDSPRARTAMSVPLMRSVIWRASTMPYPAHILRSPRT